MRKLNLHINKALFSFVLYPAL